MSKNYVVVTKKGERLIATKFGVPYGLFLAVVKEYRWLTVVANAILGFTAGFTGNFYLLLPMILNIALVFWAERHFSV